MSNVHMLRRKILAEVTEEIGQQSFSEEVLDSLEITANFSNKM